MGNSNIPNPSTAWSQRELQHPHRQGRDSVQFKHDYNMLIYDKTSDCLPHNIPLLKMGQDVLNIE
jgi:cytolysin (calcineurin-like family phosphatase)